MLLSSLFITLNLYCIKLGGMSPGRCGNGKQKERGGWDLESCEAYARRPQSFPPPLPSAKNDRLQEGGENVVEGKDEFGDRGRSYPGQADLRKRA